MYNRCCLPKAFCRGTAPCTCRMNKVTETFTNTLSKHHYIDALFLKTFLFTVDLCLNCTCAETNQIKKILIARWIRERLSATSRGGHNFLLITKVWSRKNQVPEQEVFICSSDRKTCTTNPDRFQHSWISQLAEDYLRVEGLGKLKKNWYTVRGLF